MPSLGAAPAQTLTDCWKRIGVQGDASCPELSEHVHCKNCPVYAAAAQALLDRELPEGYGQSWGRHYAEAKLEAPAELGAQLVFRVGAEWLALPASVVDEVASVRPIHVLPHMKSGVVLGVVNVRGELLVCVSLRHLVGAEVALGPDPGHARARLLVLRRAGSRFAVPVDEVHGTRRVSRAELVEPPATMGRASGIFVRHVLPWVQRSVGCLDDELVFHALERNLA